MFIHAGHLTGKLSWGLYNLKLGKKEEHTYLYSQFICVLSKCLIQINSPSNVFEHSVREKGKYA